MSYNSFATYAKRLKEQRAQLNAVPNAQSLYYRDKVEDEEEEKNKGGFFGGLGYFFEKIGLGFMQGIEGIVDYAVGGVSELLGAAGVDGAEEFAEDVIGTDWMNYNHADEWFNPSEGWKTAGDVAGGVGTSLPGLLTTVGLAAATGGASLAVQAAGLGVAGLSAAGTATKEAYQETGKLGGAEFGYGALSGAVEAGTELLTGKVLGTGLTKAANATTAALGKGATAFAKTVGKNAAFGMAKEFTSEAFEEGFAEWISPYIKRITYDPNAEKATAEEIAYAALVGGLSGVVTGGATTAVVRGKNTISGAIASKKGETATILGKAQNYMGEDAATSTDFRETVEKIYKKYQDTTGDGALAKVKRARLLGELKSAEVNGAMSGLVKRSAISATQNAEAIAQRLNSDGRYKMVDGKLTFVADSKNAPTGDNVRDITAEDIRRGYDPSKKNSLDKALKDNEVLRYVAASDAAGRFMLQATEVENAALRGEQIRNETEYKRLREEASPEARAAMSRELGIDLNTASLDDFNAAVKAYKESGKADAYQAKIKKVEEIKSKKDSKAYAIPRAISLADGGIRHYTDGQSNIAIARDGESFIIYDYDSGKVSRSLSRAEVNKALAKYREGTMNEAAVTSESAAEVKSENANNNENLSSSAENVQNAAETAAENVQEKAESDSDIWEKGVTEADRKAATEARKQAAEIDSYAKENIKDYDNLSRANKLTVRDVIRKARESGISEADALSYARVAARTGLDIQFNQKECYKGKNEAGEDVYHAGFYDPENNRIVVNPKTEKKHTVLLIHELSHAMRSYRTKGGEVKYFIDEDAKISKELWGEIKKYYSDKKGNVDMELAYDEASAYYAEALFGTEGAIDLLLGEKPTLRQKILSFFTKSAAYYSTDEKLSREARRHFKKFKAMFDSFALRNTVNNTDVAAVALSDEKTEQEEFSTANMRGEADGAVASNEVTETMVAMASGRRFSMNTEFEALPKQTMSLSTGEGTLLYMIEGLDATEVEGLSSDKKVNGYSGRAVREYAMRNNKFNKTEISNVNKFMDEMAKFMEEAGVTYRFIGLNDVENAKLHFSYDSKGNIKSIVLSAMVKNGDYPVNFDLSSICKKRVAMSTLINKLSKRGSIDNGTVDLTPANIFRINRALKDAGYETAYLGCFVESKRYNSLKWAETFCAKWNAAVKKINPNATYFNYGSSSFTEDSFTVEQAIKLDEAANKYIKATKTERLANALEKYKAKEAAGQPLIEGKLMKVDGKELNTFSKAARDRIVKSETISEELKNRYLTCDVSTLNMADVEFLLENGVLPGASLSNKQAVTEMVKSGEAYQHLLKPSDLLTDRGIAKLEELPNFHGVLYGHYGSGTPKLMQSYTPYNSEIALLPTHKNSEQTLAEYLYTIAGVRMQSFSDFQIQNIYDYLQMVADLAARKVPAHAYTKEISFAKLLGMTGIKVNLSVMYDIDTTADRAHAGLTKLNKLIHKGEYAVVVLKDEQGEWVYNIGDYQTQKMFAEAFPDAEKRFLQSIGFADAVKLQSTEGYSANCGIIGVGYSDLAIFAMLDDKRIRYIIPYHASSLPADIKIATNIELGTDYTSYQNNMKISEILDKNGNKVAWSVKEAYKRLGSGQAVINELNEKIRSEGWVVKTTKAQNGHGSYGLYEDLQQTSDPKKTASNFLDWCAKNGTLPLFYQFASHENYYKLLYDYNVYDCITEKYAPQEAVTNTYPTMQDGSVKAGNVTDGGFNTEYLESAIDKQMAFMDNYNRNLDADLDRLADNMEKGNYSFDQPLNEKFEVGKSARRYSMAGTNAATADHSRLITAKEMIADGKDSETVRKETGWFVGYDGKWRYEIDDSQAVWHLDTAKPDSKRLFYFGERKFKLTDLLDHPALYEAYPQLKEVTVWENPNAKTSGYVVGRNTDNITVQSLADREINKDILLHEIQHIIQNIEGFAPGASVDQFDYKAWGEKEFAAYEKRNEVANKLYAILRRHGVSITKADIEAVRTAFEVSDSIIDYNFMLLGSLADSNPRTMALYDEYVKQMQILNLTTPSGQYHAVAGEIEAHDVQARRRMTAEQRKNTRPNIDREDAILIENSAASQHFIGWTADGNEVYDISSSIKSMSDSDRKIKFFNDFANMFHGRVAKFVRNGHVHYARFGDTKSELGKLVYEGNAPSSKSSNSGYKAKMRMLADGNIFELVEDTKYDDTQPEIGKNTKIHQNAKHWDYYIKTIVVDGKAYDVMVNVRNDVIHNDYSTKEEYVYSIRFRDNKTAATSVVHPATSKTTSQFDVTANNSISDSEPKVNTSDENSSKNSRRASAEGISNTSADIEASSEASSDSSDAGDAASADVGLPRRAGRTSMTVGQLKKLKANYTRQKTYSRKDAISVVGKIDAGSVLSENVRNDIAESIWQIYNEALTREEREAAAYDIAKYFTLKLFSESKVENPDAKKAQEDLVYLSAGIGRLTFTTEQMNEIKHRMDKDGANSIRGRWGYKGDKKKANGIMVGRLPLETFVVDIAREMPGMEYLEDMNPIDAFLEIDTVYKATREIALDKEISAYWDVPESGFEDIVKSIQNDIMQGYIDTGSKSKFATMFEARIEYYQKRAERFQKDFEEIRGRDKINGMLVNQALRMRDLKIGKFKNATQDQNDIFKKSIETLSKIQWRGNISVKSTRKAVKALYEWYKNEDVKKGLFGYVDKDNIGRYNEGIAAIMEELSKDENKTFSKVELNAMLEVMSYFTNFVETFGKVWRRGQWIDAEGEAKRFISVIPSASKQRRGVGNITKNLTDKYLATFADPETVIRRMDNYEDGFYTEMFEDLREAAINAGIAEIDILADYEEFVKKNKHYLEKAKTETVKYKGVEIPKIDLISLYMTLRDEQSRAGFAINGFDIRHKDGKTTRVPGGLSATETHSAEEVKGYVLSQMSEIDKLFTDTDREYMKILERGYVKAGEAKAYRDTQKYGFTNVSGNYYYPIRRANISSNVDKSEIQEELDRVSNASFNKDRVKGAKQELFIEDADKLFRKHVHAVCQYANLSPVIDSYNMLYNYDVSGNPNHPTNIMTESQNVWKEGDRYFRKLISDVQGITVTQGAVSKALSAIRSNYAKFQLGANPKTWVSQLSSMFAASSVLDVGRILKSTGISGKDADAYSKVARLRHYDDAAAKAQAVADNKIGAKKDSITDIAMKPISGVDNFVIHRLFAACQSQIQADTGEKIGTEQNKILAGKLLDRVILETQQNSLATEKSAAMRSGNEFYKAITMFRADAMKVIGRVIDSYGEVKSIKQKIKAEKKNANSEQSAKNIEELKKRLSAARKKAAKATYSLAMTSIFTALVAQGFKWLYAKERDEDETFVEDTVYDIIGNMFGGLPIITDAYNYFVEGFDVENYSYTAINDFLASTQNIINMFDGDTSSQEVARGIKNLTYSLGQLSGVPTRNLYNVFYGLTKRISPETGYAIDSVFYEKNYKNDFYKAIQNEDEDMAEYILQLLVEERLSDNMGDSTYNAILSLSKDGYKILPKTVPDKITVDGVEYELDEAQMDTVRTLYNVYIKNAEGFVNSAYYNSLNNDSKCEAITYYFDLVRDRAISEALDVDRGRKVELIGLLGEDEITKLHVATKGIKSDVDKEGNTIAGSKKTKVLKAIKRLGGSKNQQILMLYAAGYTVQDGDIKGVSGERAKKLLLNAIMKLNVTKAEKAEIAKSFGFKVKNGKIIKDF